LLADLAARFPALPAVLIGAGFGANVAFNAVAVESRVRAVIMLSPGETYRDLGLRGPCDPDRIPLYVIAAGDDDYSAVSARKFAARCAGINYLEFETGGHGTYLFETHAELVDSITQFLEQELR
jgi:pimeloyl-ACP methyl ester carboxylesterase